MNFDVVFYSPDQHITYDIHTLNTIGVGGGITNRIRLAHGLNEIGCNVKLFINCPANKIIDGVEYVFFDQLDITQKCDIFIASTSGGNLDLGNIPISEISAKIKILLVHGISQPVNAQFDSFDYYYVPSNFIRDWIIADWNINRRKIFTCHLGVNKKLFENQKLKKNNFRLMYSGHPDKGLQSAISVLELLREVDKKYHLWVFGDSELWGEKVQPVTKHEGVRYFGTIGQKALAKNLQKCSYGIFLQEIPEAFGISVIEALSGGCIPIGSPVGALNETIIHGFNGIFVRGNHKSHQTQQTTAKEILKLTARPNYSDYLRENGQQSVLDWKDVAEVYASHWNRILNSQSSLFISSQTEECPICGGRTYSLKDGHHCIDCGNLIRKFENWNFNL